MIHFLHIAKTGGTSIRSMFVTKPRMIPIRHLKQERRIFPEDRVLTIVRNPYDRFVSFYYWSQQYFHPDHWLRKFKDINDCVDYFHTNKESLFRPMPNDYTGFSLAIVFWQTQMHHLRDVEGGGISDSITDILRFETLESDWGAFASKHGFSDLPHKNKSKLREDKHWSEELTDETITLINDLYSQDFEALGYDRL